jgi:hypothetical protein
VRAATASQPTQSRGSEKRAQARARRLATPLKASPRDRLRVNSTFLRAQEAKAGVHGVPLRGSPTPHGATSTPQGMNFAVFSSAATAVSLVLYTPEDQVRRDASHARNATIVALTSPRRARRSAAT